MLKRRRLLFGTLILLLGCNLFSNEEPDGWFSVLSESDVSFKLFDDKYQEMRVTNLHFLNKKEGWVTGSLFRDGPNQGFAALTENGGRTWDFRFIKNYTRAGHPYFFDKKVGIISGTVIHKTIDGGKTWKQRFNQPDDPEHRVNNITFVNDNLGWGVGTLGSVAKTKNSGDSWEFLRLNFGDIIFQKIHTNGDKLVWLLSSEKLIHSKDEGESWNEIELPTRVRFTDIHFFDENNGFLAGEFRHIYYTEDGGESWHLKYPLTDDQIDSDAIVSIDFLNQKNGLALTSQGGILATTDGGESWNIVLPALTNGCGSNIQYVDKDVAYATFGCKLFKTNSASTN